MTSIRLIFSFAFIILIGDKCLCQKTIHYPEVYNNNHNANVIISKVVLNEFELIIELELTPTYSMSEFIFFEPQSKKSFHIENLKGDKIARLKSIQGAIFGESFKLHRDSKSYKIQFTFTPIPANTTNINLIEGHKSSPRFFRFENISLGNQKTNSLVNNNKTNIHENIIRLGAFAIFYLVKDDNYGFRKNVIQSFDLNYNSELSNESFSVYSKVGPIGENGTSEMLGVSVRKRNKTIGNDLVVTIIKIKTSRNEKYLDINTEFLDFLDSRERLLELENNYYLNEFDENDYLKYSLQIAPDFEKNFIRVDFRENINNNLNLEDLKSLISKKLRN